MKQSLVAINLTTNNKLENPNEVPILFYWNGEGDLKETIFSDLEFLTLVKSNVLTFQKYAIAKVSWFYFKGSDNEDDEIYYDEILNIQDNLTLESLCKDDPMCTFWHEYIKSHFAYLYQCSFKSLYTFDPIPDNFNDEIIDIYKKLKERNPNKIIKSTVINYIRLELSKTNNLNKDNIEFLMNKLDEILKDVE